MQSAFGNQFANSAMVGLQSHHGVSGLKHRTMAATGQATVETDLNHVILGDEGTEEHDDVTGMTIKYVRRIHVHIDASHSLFCGIENFQIGEMIRVPNGPDFTDYTIDDRTAGNVADVIELKIARYRQKQFTKPQHHSRR